MLAVHWVPKGPVVCCSCCVLGSIPASAGDQESSDCSDGSITQDALSLSHVSRGLAPLPILHHGCLLALAG